MPAAPPTGTMPASDDLVTALVARQLDLALPAECIAGVGDNLALLASHWANLRGVTLPDDPA